MRRRRLLPLSAPPLGGIVIDGANVIGAGGGRPAERLQRAVAWFRAWRPDLPVTVFVDAAAPFGAGKGAPEGVRTVVCPPGVQADVLLLAAAARQRALVVSNDRFADHAELRAGVLTLQFERGPAFVPHAEATWFRTPGHAARIPLAAFARPQSNDAS